MQRLRIATLALAGTLLACGEAPQDTPKYRAFPVERRDIVVVVEAAGTLEPDVTLEVKSQASGEILELLVDTGDRVEESTLLLRIDRRQAKNGVDEAEASLEVARARLENAENEAGRAARLFKADSLSESAFDSARLDVANARSELVRARVALENAGIALEDTEVLAPMTGTVIEKNVERGQVISSPMRDVAGGTLLMRMADLSRMRVRAFVDETDIGKLRAGMHVRVTPASYPDRALAGQVLKIEPQSITEQNVTMFPVLVRVDNSERLLKPGMNCDVEVRVDERRDVLAIPYAALRKPKHLQSAALLLGLAPEQVERARSGSRDVVFVDDAAGPRVVAVETGLTDFDYVEVRSGLSEGERVLLLPSAGLVRSQERFRDRAQRVRGDVLPGLRRAER
jgi:HlyD family secretion protein